MDRDILRSLATEYALLQAESNYEARVGLHKAVNDLKPVRPVVLMSELPWHQLNIDGTLTLQCEDAYLCGIERYLRTMIFQWKHFACDMLLPPYIPVDKVVHYTGHGITADEKQIVPGDGNHIVAHEYHDQLSADGDECKLQFSTLTYDHEATMRRYQLLGDMIGDIVPLKTTGVSGYFSMWDEISMLRGVTPLLEDLVERPEHSHRIMRRLTDIWLNWIDQVEAQNLFDPHPMYIHCTAAYSDALHAQDLSHVKASDVWGRGMAQIFASVGPAMHDEFDISYMNEILSRFGLSYYGCCEPLDNKIDILRQIKNLRKVSITPWADVDRATEVIGKDYVVASKPNPAFVAETTFDAPRVRAELQHTLDACARHGCTVEFTLKDISHCGGAQHIFDWARVAMEVVGAS